MTKRKFSGKRLYKIVRVFVVIVTIFAILEISGNKQSVEIYRRNWRNCLSENTDLPKSFCNNYLDRMLEYQDAVDRSWQVALITPIVFFGGTWLFKYLFPERKKK